MTVTAVSPGVWQSIRETTLPVRAILAAVLINRTGAFLSAFLVLYLVHAGYSPVQAGLALGLHGAGGVAGGVVGGWLADQIGARYTMVVSNSAAGLLTILVVFAPSYPVVAAVVILIGLCGNAFRPASAVALAGHTDPDRYTMVFAMQRLATNIGTTAGPLLGAAIVGFSFPALFWVEGVVTLSVAVLTAVTVPNDRVAKVDAESASEVARGGLDRRYLVFLAGVVLTSAVYVQYLSTLPLHLADAGYPVAMFGVLVAINGAIVALFELPMTRWTQRWPIRPTLAANVILVGVGMALYGVPIGVAGLILATMIWSSGEIIGAPTMFAYPARVAPAHLRGSYLGACNAAVGAAFAAGPLLGAFVWARAGEVVWPLCLLLSAAAVVAFYFGIDRRMQ